MAVLAAEDVSKSYGETVALDGVSLSVDEGEVFALVGPNGAGKTTLVRALTGTIDAEGHVELFGGDPGDVNRERIGLLPQEFDPPARLTPRELLAYYGGLYDDHRPVAELLDEVGVADAAETHYENLSGGQKRRTCVAAALVNDPDLLVIDEPTTGIDPAGRRQLWDLLGELAASGTTILLTTHYMAEAEHLADRVGLLADGAVVAVDTPGALVATHGGESLLIVEGVTDREAVDRLDRDAQLVDGRLTVRNVDPVDVGGIVEALESAGVGYDSLTWREPDLEDVYLSLAGGAEGTDADGVGSREPRGPVAPGGERP
ncbi:ABC transporter ATP-binding protein [Halobacteriales archaeon SW_7_65_23]|jgi:ABC-2 type transport system ATP-binding protein|nr:MAG: ABC transporter ATP-binding protein [Halobacteriales archaeon SW_7_65_23]